MDKLVGDVRSAAVAALVAVVLLAVEAALDVAIRVPHPPSVTDCK